MTSRPTFPPKLFHDPVILKVTYIEVMGSIYIFFLQQCNMRFSFLFRSSKFKFCSYLLQGTVEAPT